MTSSGMAIRAPTRLISNTTWNVAGQLLPLIVGIVTLPVLIRLVGLERFGFISLVWVLVGYASVFDFGIGRALIRVVAAHLARGDEPGARDAAQAGQFYLGLFGLVMAAAMAVMGAWLASSVLKLPPDLLPEAVPAIYLLAASLPFVMLTTGYTGVLSAYQHFKELNLIKLAMGLVSYIGPVMVAQWWSPRLESIVGMVLAMRIVSTFVHARVCTNRCGLRLRLALPRKAASRELFTLGGWMAVSNIVGPILSYLDRLLLGVLVPMRAMAFYGTPYDLISKIMILPYSIMAAVFPLASSVEQGSGQARRLLADSVRLLFVLMLPVILPFVALAHPFLTLWLGAEFSREGAPVMQLLAVGVLLNAMAQGPATLIQAAGKPSWMAKLHMLELPVFVSLLWLATSKFGIVGTAFATALRNGLDAVLVFYLAKRGVAAGELSFRGAVLPFLFACSLLGAGFLATTWAAGLVVLAIGMPAFGAYVWLQLLQPSERLRVNDLTRRLLPL